MSKEEKSNTDQRQFWLMVLETFKSSGSSVRQFCQQEGLSEPSFYSWRKRLTEARKTDVSQSEAQQEAFIEVSMPPTESGCLELVLVSGHTLRIPLNADSTFLTGVFSAIKQAQLC